MAAAASRPRSAAVRTMPAARRRSRSGAAMDWPTLREAVASAPTRAEPPDIHAGQAAGEARLALVQVHCQKVEVDGCPPLEGAEEVGGGLVGGIAAECFTGGGFLDQLQNALGERHFMHR